MTLIRGKKMKNKLVSLILIGTISLSLIACGGNSDSSSTNMTDVETQTEASESGPVESADQEIEKEAESTEEKADDAEAVEEDSETDKNTGLANPWRECTEEEAYQYGPNGFSAPEGATNVKWSIMEAESETALPGTMVQMSFEMDGTKLVAREQPVSGEEIVDISGMNYEWTVTDEGTLQNWADGNMPCRTSRYIGDDGYVDVCLWFDIETGYAYSLSAEDKDLDGFDIEGVAAQIYDPAKQIGANMPDDEAESEEIVAPQIDISGCDTFTQIVDKKLENGMGYANVTVQGTNLLLVSSGTFDNMDGKMAAIDATGFEYKGDAILEVGSISSGGTAYPITLNDGYLYCGGNHFVSKYTVADDKLTVMESIHVVYDESGNETYYYENNDGEDYSNLDSAEYEKIFERLIEEMTSGEVIYFATVVKE